MYQVLIDGYLVRTGGFLLCSLILSAIDNNLFEFEYKCEDDEILSL